MMPKVASEIAEPLSKAKKITMISDGSGDIGAAKLTGELFFFLNFSLLDLVLVSIYRY